ncbi:hypothetical protein GPA_29560 [Gordonibacter pamelaeae 7-10-1-b]|uniref:Uncharacterized protein n=1 Tax=Gordonibacter pamelaeae 7-10-1-b TaxID=657308 RepID=D6EAZ5_9ACTN|nr:hypothetical protein GPA_29560 [Gordonibacter pamelaeae 7-10-1-b]
MVLFEDSSKLIIPNWYFIRLLIYLYKKSDSNSYIIEISCQKPCPRQETAVSAGCFLQQKASKREAWRACRERCGREGGVQPKHEAAALRFPKHHVLYHEIIVESRMQAQDQ